MNNWIIYSVYVFFILLFAVACVWQHWRLGNLKKDRAHWAHVAVEESARANHWYRQFNDVIEGKDGHWARRMIAENEAVSKGLDQAIDDHMQEQLTWEESKAQYKATIEDLEGQVHAYREVAIQKDLELRDVQQTALEMQLDLTVPKDIPTDEVYRKTRELLDRPDNN